ncbi:hypothetical protein RFI_32769, partial [Reticulomyxa filosa]
VLTEQKHQDKDDVKLGHKSDFGVPATKQLLSEQPFAAQSRNDVIVDLDIRHLDHEAKYQITDDFCKKYIISQCLATDVQEIALSENNNTFNLLMYWMCKMFEGKYHVTERTLELLQFSTSHNEGPADILLKLRQSKFALKLELEYSTECNVPARKRLKP